MQMLPFIVFLLFFQEFFEAPYIIQDVFILAGKMKRSFVSSDRLDYTACVNHSLFVF